MRSIMNVSGHFPRHLGQRELLAARVRAGIMARVGSDWSLGFYSGSIIPPVELKKIFLQDTFCEILFSSRNIYKFGPSKI